MRPLTSRTYGPLAARFPLFPGCEVVHHRSRRSHSGSKLHSGAGQRLSPGHLGAFCVQPYSLTASQQYDGLLWRSYDVNYRVVAAASGNRKWSRLDTDLLTRFFTGRARLFNPCSVCDSVSHGAADCPIAPSRTASKREFPRTGGSATPPFKKRRPFHKTWASDICAD